MGDKHRAFDSEPSPYKLNKPELEKKLRSSSVLRNQVVLHFKCNLFALDSKSELSAAVSLNKTSDYKITPFSCDAN